MARSKEYLGIARWGKLMGSMPYYIAGERAAAAAESAPIDAIYKNSEGAWVCVSDLEPGHHFRVDYEKFVSKESA